MSADPTMLEVDLLWHMDYWDGVVSGVGRHAGRWVWVEMLEEADPPERVYEV